MEGRGGKEEKGCRGEGEGGEIEGAREVLRMLFDFSLGNWVYGGFFEFWLL